MPINGSDDLHHSDERATSVTALLTTFVFSPARTAHEDGCCGGRGDGGVDVTVLRIERSNTREYREVNYLL